jgi:hypothetical protein
MFSENSLAMQGRLNIQRFDRQGHLIETVAADNAIVFSGRRLVAQMFFNKDIDRIGFLAVGTGDQAVDPDNDVKLQEEVFRKPLNEFDFSRALQEATLEDSPANNQRRSRLNLSADLGFSEPPGDESYVLREAGLFNQKTPNEGIMYNRVVFPAITKTKDFKLTLVWEIIF